MFAAGADVAAVVSDIMSATEPQIRVRQWLEAAAADVRRRRSMSERYARQMLLPQVGTAGQGRLAQAHVLVVGAGGLGCAVLPYLAAAGVGRMILSMTTVSRK